MELLCAWLHLKLGVPVETEFVPDAEAVTGVYLTRDDGVVSLERPYEDQALISMPGQAPQTISVPVRTIETASPKSCVASIRMRFTPMSSIRAGI